MIRSPSPSALLLVALALIAGDALAQPPRPNPPPGAAGDPSKRKRPADVRDGPGKSAERRADAAAKAKPRELSEAVQRLRDTRKERRRQRVEEIKRRWGDLRDKPAARNELRVHAWRMARLARMRELAKSEGKDKLVAKIDSLAEKERDRHDKKMDQLAAKKGAR